MRFHVPRTAAVALVAAATFLTAGQAAAAAPHGGPGGSDGSARPFVKPLKNVSTVASTVPSNGDVNPYGTVVIDKSAGRLHRGNVLVSNFNDAANQQGTGTTLVQVDPKGTASLFAQIDPKHLPGACPGGVGLTTALSVLPGGWVVVGSLPTTDGTSATAQAGCLIVLDNRGTVRETFSGDGINGPWDMTATTHGDRTDLFVTNVLNGTVAGGGDIVPDGTVLRIGLRLRGDKPPVRVDTTTIGSGFDQKTDPAALVIGPTGVGLSGKTLYVADTVDNRITAIPDAVDRRDSAGTGQVVTTDGKLNGPLGLAVAPNGNILTVNSGDGNLVETTPRGDQVAVRTLDKSGDPAGAGALFGLAVATCPDRVFFVDDATNTLNLLSSR
ncbi:hypothetical protein SAMN05216223_10898 [Actinacidiphila yanglinensis]|uniref:NHL repeat-containing protein n=1 Tax=Actinacidiphila yanglinensis TaxID=310779 RepID=A0A1H6C6F0_9ACTN|nr:hypothetical protein [Actinacidiphila yanglinensis]SEG68492.1 hypothetical protein SAMN05216223_10898 [Actinacidiphila yanglinensis]